jgi:hypothetical protein
VVVGIIAVPAVTVGRAGGSALRLTSSRPRHGRSPGMRSIPRP